MALPKAVQRSLDEADRIASELSGEKTGEGSSETNPDNQQIGEQLEMQLGNQNEVHEQPNNTVSQETVQAEVPEEKWAHKYHTLKGMYDAEVPRLHSQLREMQTQVSQLNDALIAAKESKAVEQQHVKSLITEHDEEAFGPELIDLINRATEAKVGTLRDRETELLREVRELKGKLGDVSERQVVSDKDRFLMALGQQVKDWETLNTDQGFLDWLKQTDPVYGLPRQAALNSAYENLDVTRVANIFNAYKALLPQAPQQRKLNPELQRQVAPTRTRSAATPTDSMNHKVYTQNEIALFYDEWRRGHYDEEEAARMEKEIHAAITDGRVR